VLSTDFRVRLKFAKSYTDGIAARGSRYLQLYQIIMNNNRKSDDSYPGLFCSERRHDAADEQVFFINKTKAQYSVIVSWI